MPRSGCTATKADGTPCKAFAVADGLCQAHHPDRAEAHREATKRGGEGRSAQRRAMRRWAMRGEAIRDEDLPSILKATLVDVRSGAIEPGVAAAVVGIAKAAVSIRADQEMEQRLSRLEERAGLATPKPLHRVK